MTLHVSRIPSMAVTMVSAVGLIVFSACSTPSARSASSAETAIGATTLAPTVVPTPTLVSAVPFPLDPAPSGASQGNAENGTTGGSTTEPNQRSRHREEREGEEGGEFGERGPIQRVGITITNMGLQLSATTAQAGSIEFDLTNQTSTVHHVLISGNGIDGDSGAIEPGAIVHLQGRLPVGRYQLTIDSAANSGSSVTLQLQ